MSNQANAPGGSAKEDPHVRGGRGRGRRVGELGAECSAGWLAGCGDADLCVNRGHAHRFTCVSGVPRRPERVGEMIYV